MAIKKSELYSSLWSSCDELRGGMDASQYKDYVLVMLFIKYVSDKYAGVPYSPITIPPGSSFKDMVALKGNPNIGDLINKKIISPIADANKLSDMPDFNDATKLGSGKEIVDRLTNLIAIFENKGLDFSKNRAEGEAIAGRLTEMEEEHGGEEGYFAELDKVNKGTVQNRLKEIQGDADAKDEIKVLKGYLDLLSQQAEVSNKIKEANAELDKKLYAKYPTLTVDEIKMLVVDDKWMATIDRDIHTEMDRISQRLTQRIKELAERYETPLPMQTAEVGEIEKRVAAHLEKMSEL